MSETLEDGDIPSKATAWNTLLFLLNVESPRMLEIKMGLWTALYGGVFARFGSSVYATSAIYNWLSVIPAVGLGWGLIGLGALQVMSVLRRNQSGRHWAARLQVIFSIAFAIGCTVSASFAAPAWVFFGLNFLAAVWVLWRLTPEKRKGKKLKE